MKRSISPMVALVLTASVVSAEESQGPSLMERGAQLFLEGLLKEMEPAIEDLEGLAEDMGPALRGFAEGMGPKLADILGQVEDWTAYEAPQILPNGDIIIRRKADRPLEEPETPPTPNAPIDL